MELTRRSVLTNGAVLGLGTLAGCTGGGGSGGASGDTVESLPTPVLGEEDAPVTVKAFEDFACPHCKTFALEHLPRIRSEYVETGTVRYEHHDFPLPVDPKWSWKIPSAARAVQDTVGVSAFFEFAEIMYGNMNAYSLELVGNAAEQVGADPETVRNAAQTERYRPVVRADLQAGKQLGVTGTPTVFVNETKAEDYTFGTVSDLIERARS
ncbi:MAG: thioredoxin domain-containing protein [Halodesulfurarchaeum sp.]